MSIKINSLNPFDKGFFGKTMNDWAKYHKDHPLKADSSNLKMSSVDDFNKYFQYKLGVVKGKVTSGDTFVNSFDDSVINGHFSKMFF